MAELKLTDEETKANSFSEWDDESIGKLVKYLATEINNDDYNDQLLAATSAALFLVSHAMKVNATSSTVDVGNVTHDGQNIGNWRIQVEKLSDGDIAGDEDNEKDYDLSTKDGDDILEHINSGGKITEMKISINDIGDYRDHKKKKFH